jgi:hypothetical protein
MMGRVVSTIIVPMVGGMVGPPQSRLMMMLPGYGIIPGLGSARLDLALLPVDEDVSSLARDGREKPHGVALRARMYKKLNDVGNVMSTSIIWIQKKTRAQLTSFAKVTNPKPLLLLVTRSTMTTESTTGPN